MFISLVGYSYEELKMPKKRNIGKVRKLILLSVDASEMLLLHVYNETYIISFVMKIFY